MLLADRPASVVKIQPRVRAGLKRASAIPHVDVVLKPLSRPKLGDIRIDDAAFEIGRIEQPFASYGNDVINMLSRHHARIFRKEGLVYLADLESRNGTTINRAGVKHEPRQLHDGDEICFGGALSYRVQITPHTRSEGILTLRLTPASADSGLDTIVITKLPFLVSKTEATFSHYKSKSDHSQELGYLSRRHAHIYQKGNQAYIEDLGSGNGTFVDGQRLVERAVPLDDGVLVAFGGTHFVYRVSITQAAVTPAGSTADGKALAARSADSKQGHVTPSSPLADRKTAAAAQPGSAADDKLAAKRSAAIPPRPVVQGTPLAEEKATPQQGVTAEGESFAERRNAERQTPAANTKRLEEQGPVSRQNAAAKGKLFAEKEVTQLQAPAASANRLAEQEPASQQNVADKGELPSERKATEQQALAATHGKVAEADAKPVAKPKAALEQPPATESKSNAPQTRDAGTQFMAAPTSFLTILCETDEPKDDIAADGSAAPVAAAKESPTKRSPRNRVLLLLSELASLQINGDPDNTRRLWWKAAAVAVALIAFIFTAYFWTGSERDLKNAVARGDYARAAVLASRLLDKHPDDVDLKARATEAGLKANVPGWLAKIRAHDFDGAKGVLAGMSELSQRDADLRPLIDELEWLGNLERLVSDRGGPEAPIRIYADEDGIEHLIGRWNEDTGEHQRALARIAGYVPQFRDWYGEALTHLRKLQSESTVYLPVIERTKSNITSALEKDDPEELEPVLKETAERYPSLGGLEDVRQDLTRYIDIRKEARSRKSGRLFALLQEAHFVTPPFEHSFRGLMQSGQLPSAALLQRYATATQAWKQGNSGDAFAQLEKMTAGPWSEDAAKELDRRRTVTTRFAAIQSSRNSNGFVDQLLAFRESLDADEDSYFVRATAADLNQQKDGVIARAQEAMNRARTSWHEYQTDGAIDASQRIETSISDDFRTRAHLLAEANKYAQQGFLIYSQVDAAGAAQWTAIREEIQSEVHEQVSKLHDLSNVVEPGLLQAKLALLGESNE